jgi:HAD superfamily hydrolase (TIGR01509 family)
MKLIIWDFDGTLVDSRPLIVAGMDFTLDKLGLSRDLKEEWLKYVGLPLEAGITNTFGPLGVDMNAALAAYRSFGHAEHEYLLKPFEGIHELLVELRSHGIPMAIATSKRTLPLERQVNRLGWLGWFDPLVTPDHVENGKPHPESLHRVLEAHHLQPDEGLMIGDTPFDMEMALRAGVPRVAVGHGFYDQKSMEPFKPLAFAPNTETLRRILLAFLGKYSFDPSIQDR